MAAQPVEWVLVVKYGVSAHRATYGRQVNSKRYSKDFIQLSRKREFLNTMADLFGVKRGFKGSVPLTYQWHAASATGKFAFKSADRPHLLWGTSLRAPQVWKMSPTPSESTDETIPGDPSHTKFADAENELKRIARRGGGRPFLLAIKLRDESAIFHLRVYLASPNDEYAWANIQLVPPDIQHLAKNIKQRPAFAWSTFRSGGVLPGKKVLAALSQLTASTEQNKVIAALDADTGRALASYLRNPGYGLFFDPNRNHDAWFQSTPLPAQHAASVYELLKVLDASFPPNPDEDATAETLEVDPDEVEVFRDQIDRNSFSVPDSTATVKTRGSAQKAFADKVKSNYGLKCAITGIETRDFLIAAHIVPWSKDQSIRLDPSNGICLSLLVDRAFEKGYLLIDDDHTVRIDWVRVGDDQSLRRLLEPYERCMLTVPAEGGPKQEYLQRRRALVVPTD